MINKIIESFKAWNIKFHTYIENEMFKQCIYNYNKWMYIASSTVWFALFEKVFTTRLINESSWKTSFIPWKDNIKEQLKYLIDSKVKSDYYVLLKNTSIGDK